MQTAIRTTNGRRRRRDSEERGRSIVLDDVRGRVEKREDELDEKSALRRIRARHLADKLDGEELERVAVTQHLINDAQKVVEGQLSVRVGQHDERVAPAAHVSLDLQVLVHKVRRVRNKILIEAVDGIDRKDSVLLHVRMPVLL